MFEVTPEMIAALGDSDLRELVERLCTAELRYYEQPIRALIAGGNQDEPDGGIDVRVELPRTAPNLDFIPRPRTGFQVKKTDFRPAAISKEMCPKGELRPPICELIKMSGAYVIVSGKASLSDKTYRSRKATMRKAVGEEVALHVDYYDSNRLSRWVNNYPAVALWVRRISKRQVLGWMEWCNWSRPDETMNGAFLHDDEARVADGRNPDDGLLTTANGIDRMRQVLAPPGGIVRLVGLSGTGKTRLAQALFEAGVGEKEALPQDQVIYCILGRSPTPSPQEVIPDLAAHRRRVLVVVDDCPPETHRILVDATRRAGGLVSLLTIEHDVGEDLPEATEVFRLETASPKVIEDLLEQRHPKLVQVLREQIVEHCGCNARLALAMAAHMPPHGSSAKPLTDKELFSRLFWQARGPVPALQDAAEICSLVYSFDFETEGKEAELSILADIGDVSPTTLRRLVAELQRRQLVQQRGRWRAVLPHVLANHLASWALEALPPQRIVSKLLAHPRLRMSFARRLGFLHDSTKARGLVEEWMSATGWLGTLTSLKHEDWGCFRLAAPATPAHALDAIERAIATTQRTGELAVAPWHRREMSTLLSAIAYDPPLFDRAVAALAELRVIEASETNERAASDAIKTLFHIRLSGTLADLDQRLVSLDKLLMEPRLHEVGRLALDAMLGTRGFVYSGGKQFGGRPRGYGWVPKDAATTIRWFTEGLGRVGELAAGEDGEWARALLARRLIDLWKVGHVLRNILEKLSCRISAQDYWWEGWVAIRRAMRLWKDALPDHDRLSDLAARLAPRTQEQSAIAYVMSTSWDSLNIVDAVDDDNAASRNEIADRLTRELGRHIARQDKILDRLIRKFIRTGHGRAWMFGRGLADGSDHPENLWEMILSALATTPASRRSYSLIGGLLAGLAERHPELATRCLDEGMDNPVLVPELPYLQRQAGWDEAGLMRLIRLAEAKAIPASAFSNVWLPTLDQEAYPLLTAQLLRAISSLPENGLAVAIDLLAIPLPEEKTLLPDALAACGHDLLLQWEPRRDKEGDDYNISRLIKLLASRPNGDDLSRIIINKMQVARDELRISGLDFTWSFKELAKAHPATLLDTLLSGERDIGYSAIDPHDDTSPLTGVPDDAFKDWADGDPPARFPRVAQVARLFAADGSPSPIMYHLIDNAPDRQAVLESMRENLGPSGGMVDEVVALYRSRSKGIEDLFSHPDPSVVSWARDVQGYLNAQAESWGRDWHSNDERFE